MEAASAGKYGVLVFVLPVQANFKGTCTIYTIGRDNSECIFQLHFLKVTRINNVLQQ